MEIDTQPAVFAEFPKIPRLSRECVITEKIDGTNGLIEFHPSCNVAERSVWNYAGSQVNIDGESHIMRVGSRKQWITPDKDNYGFAKWAYDHKEELATLGAGRHFGEWWGQGIQRNYGLLEKRFSLFNTSRWHDAALRPSCCHVAPILGEGIFHSSLVDGAMNNLIAGGSAAAPGFKNPEGIIIYHINGNLYFKKTIFKDEEYKGKQ